MDSTAPPAGRSRAAGAPSTTSAPGDAAGTGDAGGGAVTARQAPSGADVGLAPPPRELTPPVGGLAHTAAAAAATVGEQRDLHAALGPSGGHPVNAAQSPASAAPGWSPSPPGDPAGLAALHTKISPDAVPAWAEAHGQAGFIASDSEQNWSLVTKDASGSFCSVRLDGQPGIASMTAAELGARFTLLQDPAAAVGFTQLRDPVTGQTATFGGFTRDGTGAAAVSLRGADGARTLSLAGFRDQYGAAGISGIVAGVTSEPAVPLVPGARWRDTENAATGAVPLEASGSAADVQQGMLFDCYFLAGMGAALAANPHALREIIRPSANGNPGQLDVTLSTRGDDGVLRPHTVTIDGRLPVDANGRSLGARASFDGDAGGGHDRDLAPALVEKAWAVLQQNLGRAPYMPTVRGSLGYNNMEQGDPTVALEAITGRPARRDDSLGPDAPEALWQAAMRAAAGAPVVVATTFPRASDGEQLEGGIVSDHAYAVTGSFTNPYGERFIKVRNPVGALPSTTVQAETVLPYAMAQRVFGTAYIGSS